MNLSSRVYTGIKCPQRSSTLKGGIFKPCSLMPCGGLQWFYVFNQHTKHLQINNLHIFTIVFHFRHILFLQDLLIHLFFPFHMSDHHSAKGLSLSLVHDFGIHYLLIPEIRLLYQYSVPGSKHTSSKLLSLPRLFPISLDCLPGFWFLLFSFYALSNDT